MDSEHFGADLGVEGLNWKIEYFALDDSWQEFAIGTTGTDGMVTVDIYPDLTYRIIATDGWYPIMGVANEFNSTTIFPYEIELPTKELDALFLYDLPNSDMGYPPADVIPIDFYYFDGVDYQFIITYTTNEQGQTGLTDLIVGQYYYTAPSVDVPTFLGEIFNFTTRLIVDTVLLPPICILIYRKIEGKEGLFL